MKIQTIRMKFEEIHTLIDVFRIQNSNVHYYRHGNKFLTGSFYFVECLPDQVYRIQMNDKIFDIEVNNVAKHLIHDGLTRCLTYMHSYNL